MVCLAFHRAAEFGLCRATRSVSWNLVSQVVRLNALRLLVQRHRREAGLVVLDEGPVFALSWLCVFGPPRLTNGPAEPWWRKRGAEWTRLIDRVVLLDAPDPILTGRIRGRRKQDDVFRDFTDRQIIELAAAYRAAFAHVLRHLAPAGRVVTLSTEHRSPDQLAHGLASALKESRRGD